MRIVAVLLLLLSCFGCSGGVYTELAEVQMRLGSPSGAGGERVPVIYPGKQALDRMDPMVQAFGPSWRNMEDEYPAYNFNP
ncbi:hypothetical protein ACUUL3_11050 [Thiovibrio sp. JS02]